ncbi:hypothetical protein [Streptomyces sp. NBC_00388]|uniref:hypothetical protein n=1 Tax=Streptomyces sp. NBC_00388 TaxID=2975735 RepID=UPI002E20BA0E
MRRQHAAIAATATALCLGGLVAACAGDSSQQGYAAVGAAGAGQLPTTPVPPSGNVTLTPLDGPGTAAGHGHGETPGPGGPTAGEGAQGPPTSGSAPHSMDPGDTTAAKAPGSTGSSGHSGGSSGGPSSPGTRTPIPPGRGSSGSGGGTSEPPESGSGNGPSGPPGTTSPTAPARPALLKAGPPDRAATDKRWCEKVTVRFSNTGGSPVTSGTATFSTHIIGGLGVDWATRTSSQPLPGPIAAGRARTKTYTVCVDDWRVPLGMHIETRKVSVSWK